jgi:hypothetical protein
LRADGVRACQRGDHHDHAAAKTGEQSTLESSSGGDWRESLERTMMIPIVQPVLRLPSLTPGPVYGRGQVMGKGVAQLLTDQSRIGKPSWQQLPANCRLSFVIRFIPHSRHWDWEWRWGMEKDWTFGKTKSGPPSQSGCRMNSFSHGDENFLLDAPNTCMNKVWNVELILRARVNFFSRSTES